MQVKIAPPQPQPCLPCLKTRGKIAEVMGKLKVQVSRVAVFNRAGWVDGKAVITYGVRIHQGKTITPHRDPNNPQGFKTLAEAQAVALTLATSLKLPMTHEAIGEHRLNFHLDQLRTEHGLPPPPVVEREHHGPINVSHQPKQPVA